MFNHNNAISQKQLIKSLFSASYATCILLLLYNYESPMTGIVTILLTYTFSFLTLAFYKAFPKITTCKIFKILQVIKYALSIFLSTYLLYFTLSYILRINIKNIFLMICIIFLCSYIANSDIEKISRFAELIIWILVIPSIVIISTSITKISITRLYSSFTNNIFPSSWMHVIIFAFVASMLIHPVELATKYSDTLIASKTFCKFLLYSLISVLIFYFITLGIFGRISTEYTVHPFFSLSQMTDLGDTYDGRLEGIVSIILFVSLLYGISFYMFHIKYIVNPTHKTSSEHTNQKRQLKGIVSSLLGILALTISSTIVYFCFMSVSLGGDNEPPEERSLVESIYIDNSLCFNLTIFADDDTKQITTNLKSLQDVEKEYSSSTSLKLDFSHTSTIVVNHTLYQNKELLKLLLIDFKRDLRFSENLTIIDISTNENKKLFELYL